ncbi:MAG: hypothetical protein JWL64_570, partial [Frankiales bacterium]|nr:hypothetical protein [Frankiales bacterium]
MPTDEVSVMTAAGDPVVVAVG